MLALDHVYFFVEPGFPEEDQLTRAGFNVKFGRQHDGLGTENRLLLLDDAYLEFLWVRNPQEARANILRFDRRQRACPFGIALRGTLPRPLHRFFGRYRLPGYPLGQLRVFEPSRREPMLPLLFVLESSTSIGPPQERGYPSALFEHSNGSRRMTHLTFAGPNITRSVLPGRQLPIRFREWPSWHLDVVMDAPIESAVTVPGLRIR